MRRWNDDFDKEFNQTKRMGKASFYITSILILVIFIGFIVAGIRIFPLAMEILRNLAQ